MIAAQGKSGLSVREFAGLHGLSPATLYWWRSKLRRDRTLPVPAEVIEDPDLDSAGATDRHVDPFELSIDERESTPVSPI